MKNTGLNILIAGSKSFEDKQFAFQVMDNFLTSYIGKIDVIYTSDDCQGSSQYVREWVGLVNSAIEKLNEDKAIEDHNGVLAKIKPIQLRDCTFDMHLAKENSSLYEDQDLPDFIIENDPFFIKGKDLVKKSEIDMVIAFPNAEGKLGASTRNINRFAKLAGIESTCIDCSVIYRQIKQQNIQNESVNDVSSDVKRSPKP